MDAKADDLILFTHVMEAGSFAQAALRVGQPKSTVSRRITMLEQNLGERLLTRSTRWLTLTDFGSRVLQHARRLRRELDEVAALAASEDAALQGQLRISVPPCFLERSLGRVLMDFAHQYPQVSLDLNVSARPVDLLREKFDLALRIAHQLPDDDALVARPVRALPGGLYASPDYLASRGVPGTPQDLERHACLQFRIRGNEVMSWRLRRGRDVCHHTPQGPMGTNSIEMIRLAALQGMGIAALDHDLAACLEAQGALVPVLPDWTHPVVTVWAVTPGRHLVPARTRALLGLLEGLHVPASP